MLGQDYANANRKKPFTGVHSAGGFFCDRLSNLAFVDPVRHLERIQNLLMAQMAPAPRWPKGKPIHE